MREEDRLNPQRAAEESGRKLEDPNFWKNPFLPENWRFKHLDCIYKTLIKQGFGHILKLKTFWKNLHFPGRMGAENKDFILNVVLYSTSFSIMWRELKKSFRFNIWVGELYLFLCSGASTIVKDQAEKIRLEKKMGKKKKMILILSLQLL